MKTLSWRIRDALAARSSRFQFPPQRIAPRPVRGAPISVPLHVALPLLGFGLLALLFGGLVLGALAVIVWALI
ncbi:MAG: hypothetical protein ACREUG_09160 [Steroidobacteraceae bacterium]